MAKPPRIYVEESLKTNYNITLGHKQTHYLRNVMRYKEGNILKIFNGIDGEWLAIIITLTKKQSILKCQKQIKPQTKLKDIKYLFAPLKHARLDYMVQKATELGANELQPVLTEYTITKKINLERIHANIIEAAEQCNLLSIPQIIEPISLNEVIENIAKNEYLIFCNETEGKSDSIEILRNITKEEQIYSVLVGPEGGFSPEERKLLISHPQTISIYLGPRIMRAETAAIAALTLVQATIGDW